MTPHFSPPELRCKCNCGMLPAQEFMDKIELLRMRYGRPLRVSSAARCPTHNRKVSETGGAGPHTTGRAIDFEVMGADAHALLVIALDMGFTGIGVQQKGAGRFIHIDDLPNSAVHPRPRVWTYF